jgi:uncharacterized repeat protein (TIGR01451 family)
MHFMVYRFLIIVIILLTFGMFSGLALAQESPILEINLLPQTEFAVAGQPFTYTLTLTNKGAATLKDIILFIDIPAGTTLANTQQPADWYTSLPPAETDRRLAWATQTPIEPGSTVTFTLIVNVPPDMVNQELVCQTYGVVPLGTGDMLASGPPVTTQVMAVLPTATANLLPTATPTAPPSPTSTATPTTTPLPPTATPATAAAATGSSGPGMMIVLIIGAGLAVGLVWVLTKRR